MPLPEGLLSAAKNYLDITWDDEESDRKLEGILLRGMNRLDTTCGELVYDKEARPRELLFEYARYAYSNALDEWEDAYLSEILFIKHMNEIDWEMDDDSQ